MTNRDTLLFLSCQHQTRDQLGSCVWSETPGKAEKHTTSAHLGNPLTRQGTRMPKCRHKKYKQWPGTAFSLADQSTSWKWSTIAPDPVDQWLRLTLSNTHHLHRFAFSARGVNGRSHNHGRNWKGRKTIGIHGVQNTIIAFFAMLQRSASATNAIITIAKRSPGSYQQAGHLALLSFDVA